MIEPTYWRKCTTCKKLIQFEQTYWVCSVSTCNRSRAGLVFCNVACFDAHVPVLNHRDAGAFEKRAPSLAQWKHEQDPASAPKPAPSADASTASEEEILVVVSKVKQYIRNRSGMNTSDSVMHLLSERIRKFADQGIQSATQSGRKTVLDRDF